MSSPESRLYGKITPTTRLKNVIADLAKMRVAIQHLEAYDGTNLSPEQLYTVIDTAIMAPESAVEKLEELKKRIKDFLRRV